MHYRAVDEHGVVHYADKTWRKVQAHVYRFWCRVEEDTWVLTPAKPRNQPVTCLFCLHLRAGARSGKPV